MLDDRAALGRRVGVNLDDVHPVDARGLAEPLHHPPQRLLQIGRAQKFLCAHRDRFEDGLVAAGRDGRADQFRQRLERIDLGGRPLTFVAAVVQPDVSPQMAAGEHRNSHRRLDASQFEKLASGFFEAPDVADDDVARRQPPQPRFEAEVDHDRALRVLEKGRRDMPGALQR